MVKQSKFDIALSFAGEDRPYVDQVANILRAKGVSVFYDKFEEATLWGKNLYDYLSDIYRNQANYTIMFRNKHYGIKLWANHERQSMQSRAFQENEEYILPARFDQTEIPGLLPTTGYISLNDKEPIEFAEIIFKKLVQSGRTIPSENVRKSLSSLTKVPNSNPSTFTVIAKNESGLPIGGAVILLVADNNTYLKKVTSSAGQVDFQINTRRNYKLYFANYNYPSYVIERIDPIENIIITVNSSENIGSIICESTGYINGLKGRLNPILDTSNRTYLYADNIAINGGIQQPATFKINEPLDLEDSEGVIMQIMIKDIQGRTSLVEYVKPLNNDLI